MNEVLKKFQVLSEGRADIFWYKLTKKNGWTPTFAQNTFEEYKKFLHLIVKYNQRLVPSKTVDTVWHLHMTFTQSYWNELCYGILQQEVHHTPSAINKHAQQTDFIGYQQTLALYEKEFGYAPPQSVWSTKPPKEKLSTFKIVCFSLIPLTFLTACTSTFSDDTTLLFKWVIGIYAVYKVTKWLSGGKGGGGGGSSCGGSCGGD